MAEVQGPQPEQHQAPPGTTAEHPEPLHHLPEARAGQPDEIAPSSLFFAAEPLSSSYTGEVLAPIGGETLPG